MNTFIETFNDFLEEGRTTEQDINMMADTLKDRETLDKALPEIGTVYRDIAGNIGECDEKIKFFQEGKKGWTRRLEILQQALGAALGRLNITKVTAATTDGTIKLSTSSRTCLEVDDDWLTSQYQPLADQLQAALPDYVKVKLAVDKNKLFAHVKGDPAMLTEHPEHIHTKVSTSTTIK